MIQIGILRTNPSLIGHDDLFVYENRLRLLMIADTYYWRDLLPEKDNKSVESIEDSLVTYFEQYLSCMAKDVAELPLGQTLYCPFDLSDEYQEAICYTKENEDWYSIRAGFTRNLATSNFPTLLYPELNIVWRHTPVRIRTQHLMIELKRSVEQTRLINSSEVDWITTCLQNLRR